MKRRLVFWILLLTVLIGFGWYKNRENEADRVAWDAWSERVTQLRFEAVAESTRVSKFIDTLSSQPDAKQQAEEYFNDGNPFDLNPEGQDEVATWTHPDYGFQVRLRFHNNWLKVHGMTSGSALVTSVNPEPQRPSFTSSAEVVRLFVIQYGVVWIWLAALIVAITSRRYGFIASEVMVAFALMVGTANLLPPKYSLTFDGIKANDSLFWPTVMYAWSLLFFAFHLAQNGYRPRFRFGIRTILLVTTVAAVLFALRPAGLVALSVVGISAPPFFLLCHLFANRVDYLRSHADRLELERAMRTGHRMSR